MTKHLFLATAVAVAFPAAGQVAQAVPQGDATSGKTAAGGAGASAPAPAGTQVARVVDQEFGTYDENGDGELSQAEFGAWMVALKSASDPATQAGSPATRKWIGAAFAQADKDGSKSLTREELTGFLLQGPS